MKDLNIAILTATPDLISQNLLFQLIQQLKSYSIYPIAIIPKVFSSAESFMLYNGIQTHPRTNENRLHSNWLSPRLFTGGMSVVLVLITDDKEDLQEKLRFLKGGSRLNEKNADKLRGISTLCDRSHSLIHSPDDKAGFNHEIKLLFGNDFLTHLYDKRISDDLIKIFSSKHINNTLELLPLLIQKAYCLFLMDPEFKINEENLLLTIQKISELRQHLSKPYTSNTLDHFWNSLSSLSNNMIEVYNQLMQNPMPKDLKPFNRYLAKLQLARVIIEACNRSIFDPITSGSLIKCFNDIDHPLNHWEQQQLHIIAAYHN